MEIQSSKNEFQPRYIELIEIAKNASKKGEMLSLHGAVIANGREIIATGYNKYRYRMRGTGKSRFIKGCTVHAEIDAINNCDKKKLRGAIMIVVRYDRVSGGVKASEPCNNCRKILKKMIEQYGLLKVYYTI